ncbi:YdbL family probable chaperone protein [Wenzhouxiangella sp. EGI_FJ10409]|uniref:YdbL family protein n=1 Tax=Wenzhouxiangella sp. EGI_FJ10409 TaxID=3243767 RepID=UPI0035DE3BCE
MHRFLSMTSIASVMMLAACVTINVYFPEAAAEKAADRFIRDVLGEDVPAAPSSEPQAARTQWWHALSPVGTAHAQSPDIDIDTPQIQAIKERMAERQREHLAAWFDAGAIGFSNDGLVEIRDRSAVSLGDRRNLERVVGEENSDRNAVYREIAIANGHPEWEDDIRKTFARQWIANARSGWYYQTEDGSWTQK